MKSSMESGSADWLASPLEANVPGPMGTVERNMRLRGFGITHLWLPLIAFLALAVPLMGWQGDEWIADRLYASEGHRWTLVFNFVTVDAEQSIGEQHHRIRDRFRQRQRLPWPEWNLEAVAEWLAQSERGR